MLPLILHPEAASIGLIGAGEALQRREALLAGAGADPVRLEPGAATEDIAGLRVLFVAGLPDADSTRLASLARAAGVLVNVEDRLELCDFHVPAVVRRGDLLVSVSTSGRSPGLAKLVRQWLEQKLPAAWGERLAEAAAQRAEWRGAGVPPSDVSARTAALVAQREWLP